jgi:hypothetical protein
MIGPTDRLHSSPEPHFKTFHVFLIYCPKRPSFSTIQSHAPNVVFYQIYSYHTSVKKIKDGFIPPLSCADFNWLYCCSSFSLALQLFVSFGLLNYFFPFLHLLHPLFPVLHSHFRNWLCYACEILKWQWTWGLAIFQSFTVFMNVDSPLDHIKPPVCSQLVPVKLLLFALDVILSTSYTLLTRDRCFPNNSDLNRSII